MSNLQNESEQKIDESSKKTAEIPATFKPLFWKDSDGRTSTIKEIKRRVEKLQRDSGADSVQKKILCQRIVFLEIQLETIERLFTDRGKIAPGLYVTLCNALTGQLRLLGIERQVKTQRLNAYLKKQKGA